MLSKLASVHRDELLGCSTAELSEKLGMHGALFVDDFASNPEVLTHLTDKHGERWTGYPGRTTISGLSKLQLLEGSSAPLASHSELSAFPAQPDVIWFMCADVDPKASSTQLVDGIRVADSLPATAHQFLHGRKLRYRMRLPLDFALKVHLVITREALEEVIFRNRWQDEMHIDGKWLFIDRVTDALTSHPITGQPMLANSIVFNATLSWCAHMMMRNPKEEGTSGHYIQTVIVPNLTRLLRVKPGHGYALSPTMEDGEPLPRRLIRAISDTMQRVQIEHNWCRRDLLILDNKRFMHGRARGQANRIRKLFVRHGDLKL